MKSGVALKREDLNDSDVKRFNSKFRPFAGCLIWTGSIAGNGYGVFRIGGRAGKQIYAHRVAYVLEFGDVPNGVMVLHQCDQPQCVKPTHLFLGSAKDNAQDMASKGRHACQKGTRTSDKLNAVDVERIHDLRRAGHTQREIGDWLGISDSMVCMILSGKRRASTISKGTV